MTPDVHHALRTHAERGEPRGASPIFYKAVELSSTPTYVVSDIPATRHGRLRMAMAVVIFFVVAVLGLHLAGAPRSVDVFGRLTGSDSSDPFAPFDPREVDHVRELANAQPNAHTPDATLIATLEFRRTCRYIDRALEAAKDAPDSEREALVRMIMDPELERADASPSNHISLTSTYHQLSDEMASGNYADAENWIQSECTGDDTLTGGYIDNVRP